MKYGADGKQYEESKCALLDRRAALKGEITTVLRDIGLLEREVDRITAEIAETGTRKDCFCMRHVFTGLMVGA